MRISHRAGHGFLWPALFVCPLAFASPPLLSYATYLNGTSANAIAVDSAGNAYVGLNGSVVKLDAAGARVLATYALPNIAVNTLALDAAGDLIAAGAAQSVAATSGTLAAGITVGYVAKFDATGKPVFAMPVSSVVAVSGVALDAAANIYLTGAAPTSGGDLNAVAVKLTSAGALVYNLSFGGSQNDAPRAIAVDSQGDVFIAGDTLSADFPVTPGAAQAKFGGGASAPGYGAYGDAFLVKLDPAGAKILFGTYWGGSSSDAAYALAVDAAGNAYIAGGTSSSDYPVSAGAFQTRFAGPAADPTAPNPAGDAFVAKFSSSGASLWSTYWGGAAADAAYALALDAAGDVFFAGTSESFADYPRSGPALATCRQTGGPFVAALDSSGARLIHATLLAGLGYDYAYALALDSSGAAYLAGKAASQVFFATPGAAQTAYAAGASDAYAARVDFTASGIYAACVLNGASFAAGNTSFFALGTVAPGEIVSIFGSALGPAAAQGVQLNSAGNVSSSVAGVTVTFDGIAAPLLYVSGAQINAAVPYGLTSASTRMTVNYAGQSYGPLALPVAAAVPAIFTATQTGSGQAAALNQDGSFNSIANPAARGSVITFYAEGAGIMSPSVADGAVTSAAAPPAPALPVTVSIRGANAAVQYAGAAPAYVSGLLQVNVVVPTSIDFGNLVPLMLNIGSFSSQLDITIAVK